MTSGPQITNILLVIVRLGRPCKGIPLYDTHCWIYLLHGPLHSTLPQCSYQQY